MKMEIKILFSLILLSHRWLLIEAQNDVPYGNSQIPAAPMNPTGPQIQTNYPGQPSGPISNDPTYTGEQTFPLYSAAADPLKGRRIVCLYNNNNYYSTKFTPSRIDSTICTHVNYEFAILDPKTYEMASGNPVLDLQKNFYDEAVDLKKKNPNLKVMLSLGGWDDSTKKYSELVQYTHRIDNFIEKAVPFLKMHGFDGLDVAWEYPNCWQGALGISPSDKHNFAIFLQKIRNRFDTENLILSVSVSALKREILAAYDGPSISKAVHHINVMAYDMHGPWEHLTGHNSQFEQKAGDDDLTMNAKTAMHVWAGLGVDKMKLNLGVPTYSRTFTLLDPSNHGPGAPTKGAGRPGPLTGQGGFMCYSEVCQLVNSGNWTEEEDQRHGFYAYSGDQWASYDPPMMMVEKAKWVAMNGFGGILIKDCSCDDYNAICFSVPNPLMRMTRLELIHRIG